MALVAVVERLLALEWARPAALAGLLLPALLLVLARVLDRPRAEPVGTLAVWERAGIAPAEGGRRRRRRLPPGLVLVALALAAGALALAGPRLADAPTGRLWTVVVDRSPGLFLPYDGGAGEARLAVALRAAEELLEENAAPDDRARWVGPGLEPSEHDVADGAPAAARARPETPLPRPRLEEHDLPGAIWVTDRAPAAAPARAGVARSGGASVPGLAAADVGRGHAWDGVLLREVEVPARRVRVRDDVHAELAAFVATWAEVRGHALADGPGAALVVEVGALPPGDDVRVLEADPVGGARVAARPGVVRVVADWSPAPGGTAAAFAVAWGERLDAAILPPAGLVPVAHRRDAGGGSARPPREAPPPLEGPSAPPPLDAWLALLAALLAGGAALRVARGRR